MLKFQAPKCQEMRFPAFDFQTFSKEACTRTHNHLLFRKFRLLLKNLKENPDCREAGINFIYMDFLQSNLAETCPALSWDRALLLFSWVNRFPPSKMNCKASHFSTVLVYLNYANQNYNDFCTTCMYIHTTAMTSDEPETQHQGL